ncbi:hypothetical protein F1721_06620 [Saccharopolyspora hirsuta]|uniref:Uncharacterized protein n=1 Tax=Saccharopolyspora hirsuta TaxID=1837 RepID=A0A5M7C0S2_SACHI|nr:hypothetical protein [Saccharopolyspora hirsuta]KAA5836016.1 hypothetical protein F1721_06620 [Saccharopolyspora hirsuta]
MAQQKAFGQINGQYTEFEAAHRAFNNTPAALQVTISVPMSYEDIAAAYYTCIVLGGTLSDLDDVEYAHKLVFDTLINDTGDNIDAARRTMAEAKPGTPEYVLVQAIQARVIELFAPVSEKPSARRQVRSRTAVSA